MIIQTTTLRKKSLRGDYESKRKWRLANPKKHALTVRRWRERHPEEHRKRSNEYRRRFCERFPEKVKEAERKHCRLHKGAYQKKKYHEDVHFRIRVNLSGRIRAALKGISRSDPTMKLIGCSIENLWLYLESKFETGMTRDNYGKVWHLDHIMPCAIFDLTKTEHQRRCFHFSNLQPLFARENIVKGSRIITDQFQLI